MKIGIFDSGYGGLTILSEIRRVLPGYDYIYLGDNARAPYGTHSFDVIYSYTLQAVEYLFNQGCALVILACNTASAKALRTIQQTDLPRINADKPSDRKVNVLGVIRPTVEAVPSLTKNGHIGILATPATVSSESYVLELQKFSSRDSQFSITQQACPMWVPLIENGEHLHPGADYFVDQYLSELFGRDPEIDTLVLGCTHYPLLKAKIATWIARSPYSSRHNSVSILSQGRLVADSLKDYLYRHPEYRNQLSEDGSCRYLTTEHAGRFAQSASLFLQKSVQAVQVAL